MCGIAGIFYFKSHNFSEEPLRRMVAALSHRGPDHQGIFTGTQGALGHSRLSIIDLSEAANQPMQDESRRYAVVFNGEIYNFQDLRKTLGPSTSFFSHSDTEVILKLFQQHRSSSWRQLNGMFAIAILDNAANELFLARDHAGIKPLYYYHDSEKLIFASEPGAILSSGLIATEIDNKSISLYLQLGYFPAPFTPFQGIRKLSAGHCMKVSSGGIEVEQYWKLPEFESGSGTKMDDPEKELERLLILAVERQMISDVPIGAFLSGGIDSSLIVTLMNRISGSRIRTFTAGFSGMGYYDERRHAKTMANLLNTEHHEFALSDALEELVPKVAAAFGEPFADSSCIPTYCLSELTAKHVKVALSGTGGDEIFGGYRKYMAAQWASAYVALPASLRKTIRKTVGLLPASRKSLWQERALLLQRFSDLSPENSPALQLNTIFSAREVQTLTGEEPLSVESLVEPGHGTIAESMMTFDYKIYLPEDLLVKEDRCTMAFGLEARVPYLDRDLIEFMSRLPLRYKVSRTETKALFRKVAAKYLPSSILRRPKHGFGSPASEWIRNELKAITERAVFDPGLFQENHLLYSKWEEHQSGVRDHSRALWAVLMLHLWKANL